MSIVQRVQVDQASWNRANDLQGGFALATFEWLSLAPSVGMQDRSFAVVNDSKVVAIFPIWISDALNYRRGVSMPFGVAIQEASNLLTCSELRQHLKNDFDVVKINSFHSECPMSMKLESEGLGAVINVLESEQDYLLSLAPRLRKYVRSADKDPNIVCTSVSDKMDIEECWRLYMKSMKYRNSPGSMTKEFFERICETSSKYLFAVSKHVGKPTIFLLLIGSNKDAFAIATGVDRDSIVHAQTPHLMNFAVNWARENEFEKIHLWGGLSDSKSDELLNFKLKYSQPENYYVFVKRSTIRGYVYSKLERVVPSNVRRKVWAILRSSTDLNSKL